LVRIRRPRVPMPASAVDLLPLDMANTPKNTLKSRMIAILDEDGFNGTELTKVTMALEDVGGHVQVVSTLLGRIKGADGQESMVEKSSLITPSVVFDVVFIPGGKKSVDALKANGDAMHFVNEASSTARLLELPGRALVFWRLLISRAWSFLILRER